jgi:FkbH-like protein
MPKIPCSACWVQLERCQFRPSIEGHQNDLEEFLKSLEMEAIIEEIGPSNMERVVTMLSKTNQFNLTTRRHSRTQVQSMLESPGSIALTLRLRDKFGDQGIITILLAIASREDATLSIDSFVVSCKALGRAWKMLYRPRC